MAAQDIADASGISVTLVRRLLRSPADRPTRISRTTADAILGIPIPTRNSSHASGGRGLTNSMHAAAILTTLAGAGWPATYLASRLGISTQTIAAIRDQRRRRIRIPLDQSIRALYPRLAATSPAAAGIPSRDAARAIAFNQRRRASGCRY